MRNKMLAALAIIGAITIVAAYLLLFQPEDVIDPIYGLPTGEKVSIFTTAMEAWTQYDAAKEIDYDAQRIESEKLKGQIANTEAQIHELQADLVNVKAEHAEKEYQLIRKETERIESERISLEAEKFALMQELDDKRAEHTPVLPPDKIFLSSSSDVVYSLLLESLKGTTSDVVTFVGTNAHDGYYTVKFVGYLDSLSELLDNITTNMEDYDVSIGHCSLRQIYSCYDNMRPWDKTSLLHWFKNSYVSGSGDQVNIDGGYIINGININGILGEDTKESLTAAKDKDVKEVMDFYQERLDKIEDDYFERILYIYRGQETGISQDKINASIAAALQIHDTRKAETIAERDAKIAEIIKTYNDRIAALDNPPSSDDMGLGNPDLLIYTLDITISVYND